jgi:hypothetical protein
MGKRSAVVELFLGNMGSIQREIRPSMQREDPPTMETKLEQIAAKAVKQRPKSVVRGAIGEVGMSLPVQVWSVQSRASRTGARLAGVAATRGPKRRQRSFGV